MSSVCCILLKEPQIGAAEMDESAGRLGGAGGHCEQGYNSPRCDRRSGARPDPDSTRLLLAAERAVDVGAGILRRGRSHIGALIGKGDRDFATDVDVHVESAVRVSLANDVPEISFLGEEEAGEQELGRPSWVFDPIDGTINFARGSPLCAISLSLVIGGQPVLGIVDAPLLGERFIARQGAGAYLNGTRISVASVAGLREAIVGVADFKVGVGSEEENRVHLAVVACLARESLRVRMHGSAALDLAWLATGRLNATLMLSNLPWDVSAGLLLVREAGGFVYDYDGLPHDAESRYTLASAPSLVEPVRGIVVQAM
jgi:myo-inositol-1(or 4)-monophosphatase